jgi:hypothetical protein
MKEWEPERCRKYPERVSMAKDIVVLVFSYSSQSGQVEHSRAEDLDRRKRYMAVYASAN